MNLKYLILAITFAFISACGGGSSSSGGGDDPIVTAPGDSIPTNFVGVYTGTLNYTISASGISESGSFPLTIDVRADGTIIVTADDETETLPVGLTNAGNFSGSVDFSEDGCTASLELSGSVDGTTASGNVSGSGECTEAGLTIDVNASGDFSATK